MRHDMFDHDKFNEEFEKTAKRSMWAMLVVWVIGGIFGLALGGVLIWAIIRLVMKYT